MMTYEILLRNQRQLFTTEEKLFFIKQLLIINYYNISYDITLRCIGSNHIFLYFYQNKIIYLLDRIRPLETHSCFYCPNCSGKRAEIIYQEKTKLKLMWFSVVARAVIKDSDEYFVYETSF